MTDFVKWVPKFSGDRPPHWTTGMDFGTVSIDRDDGDIAAMVRGHKGLRPQWNLRQNYYIPREAVEGPTPKLQWAEWTPKFPGDAPPNWKDGMRWNIEPTGPGEGGLDFTPSWNSRTKTYYVDPKALQEPLKPLVDKLRTYPEDELKKQGVTLGEPVDEVLEALREVLAGSFDHNQGSFARLIRTGGDHRWESRLAALRRSLHKIPGFQEPNQ